MKIIKFFKLFCYRNKTKFLFETSISLFFTARVRQSDMYVAFVFTKLNDYFRNIEEYEISVVLKKSFRDFFCLIYCDRFVNFL